MNIFVNNVEDLLTVFLFLIMGKLTLIQWTGENRMAISEVLDSFECAYSFSNETLHIFFDDEEMAVEPSDWICENNKGEIEVLNHSDFTDKYGIL